MAVWYWFTALLMLLTLSIIYVVGMPIVETAYNITYNLPNTTDAVRQVQNRVIPTISYALLILIIGSVILMIIAAQKKEYDTAYGGYREA